MRSIRAGRIFGVIACAFVLGASVPGATAAEASGEEPAPARTDWQEIESNAAALGDMLANNDEFGRPRVEPNYKSIMQHGLSRLNRAVEERNPAAALQACEEMRNHPAAPLFRKVLKDVSSACSAMQRAEQSNAVAQVRALVRRLPAACAQARTVEEVQALHSQCLEAQATLGPYLSRGDNPAVNLVRNEISSALQGVQEWMACLAAEAAGDEARALESLARIQAMSLPGEWLSSDLVKRMERLRAVTAERIEAALVSLRQGLSNATNVTQVSALAADFNRQASRLRRAVSEDYTMQQVLEAGRSVAESWKRVLLAEQRGDVSSALQALASAESNENMRPGGDFAAMLDLKRSSLMRKMLDRPAANRDDDPLIACVDQALTAADTLEKLIALQRQLAPLASLSTPVMGLSSVRSAGVQPEIHALLTDLAMLEQMQEAVKARRFPLSVTALSGGSQRSHRWRAKVAYHFDRLSLAAVASGYELGELALGEGETVPDALLAAADAAAAAADWERLGRCLDAYRAMRFGLSASAPLRLQDQIQACRSFVAAVHYEQAGEVERAALAYAAALQAPATRSPVKAAIEALARLRREHPGLLERLSTVPTAATAPVAPATGVEAGHDIRRVVMP